MDLFQDDVINISEIITVNKFETKEEDVLAKRCFRYNGKLPTYELIYILSGKNEIQFSDVKISESADCFRYMPKGIDNSHYSSLAKEAGFCIDIYFNTTSPMPDKMIGKSDMSFLKNNFIKIYNLWSEKKHGYYIKSMRVIYSIIEQLKSCNESYLTTQQRNNLENAMDYILQNYSNRDFDYGELCRCTGLSYSYFKKLFIARYKVPPSKFILDKKIDLAKELLITGRYSITEIAEMCGFENVYYFSTVFKKQMGVSPKKYSCF